MTTTPATATVNDRLLAFIRTYVPYAIGGGLTWLLATYGLDLTGPFQVALVAFSTAVVTTVYYLAVRLIEDRLPMFGILLGAPRTPEYPQVSNLWASLVRTAIPTLVGALIVSLSAIWVHFDATSQALAIAAVTALVNAAYYTLAQLLTARWPRASWLLGTTTPPAYARHLATS